ncbi:MAG: hypothetical protein Q7S79_03410 [bacterium]|nr:hypothetical protein [bacterium]
MKLNPHKTGLALGAFAGLMHVVWSLAVATGFAKVWLDFVLSIHFLDNPYTILEFNLGQALLLVVVASVVGYAVGNLFALVWNKVQK